MEIFFFFFFFEIMVSMVMKRKGHVYLRLFGDLLLLDRRKSALDPNNNMQYGLGDIIRE